MAIPEDILERLRINDPSLTELDLTEDVESDDDLGLLFEVLRANSCVVRVVIRANHNPDLNLSPVLLNNIAIKTGENRVNNQIKSLNKKQLLNEMHTLLQRILYQDRVLHIFDLKDPHSIIARLPQDLREMAKNYREGKFSQPTKTPTLVEAIAALGVAINDEELQRAVKCAECYRDKPFSQFRQFMQFCPAPFEEPESEEVEEVEEAKEVKLERKRSRSLTPPPPEAYQSQSNFSSHSPSY